MFLVSACLAGLNTRYDGKSCCVKHFQSLVAKGEAVPVCPEQLAGLPTPREKMELVGGDGDALLKGKARAVGRSGKDCTMELIKGANEVLKIARLYNVRQAFLKEGSPSCGCNYIKSGNEKIKGKGVTAAALIKAGINVRSEHNRFTAAVRGKK